MTEIYKKGSKVTWQWQSHEIQGIIEEIYHHHVEKTIKGSLITRNGSQENPAYYISEIGKNAYVLKLKSELQ